MNELTQMSFLLTYYNKKETDQIYLSETTRQPFNKSDLNCHLWLYHISFIFSKIDSVKCDLHFFCLLKFL